MRQISNDRFQLLNFTSHKSGNRDDQLIKCVQFTVNNNPLAGVPNTVTLMKGTILQSNDGLGFLQCL